MILGLYIGSVYLQGASWRIELMCERARSSTISKKQPPESRWLSGGEGFGPMFRLEFRISAKTP